MSGEKRSRTRVRAAFSAEVHASGRMVFAAVRDVSLKGLQLAGQDLPAVGKACRVVVSLGPGAAIECIARVVRELPDGAALAIESMDADSFNHLRKLVRLHAQDPDNIDDEITSRRS